MWTQKLSDQLNLAHVARKKMRKEETKTNKRYCPLKRLYDVASSVCSQHQDIITQ